MLGKIEGKSRRQWQRMRWFDSITISTDMNLSKLWEIMEIRGGWHAAVHVVAESDMRVTEQLLLKLTNQFLLHCPILCIMEKLI